MDAPNTPPADDAPLLDSSLQDAPDAFGNAEVGGIYGSGVDESVSEDASQAPQSFADTHTPKREFTHPDQLARYMRNALARGDQDAIERISRDKEASKTYVALNEAIETRAAERAQQIAQSESAYTRLEELRQLDRETFAEQMTDPDVAAFYGEMRRWKQQGGAQRPAAPTSPLMGVYRTLRADPDAAVLTDEDWDSLDPDNFREYEPAAAQVRMTRQLDRLIAQRSAGKTAKPNPNAVNPAAVRDAIRNSPPNVGGTPPTNMTDREIRDAYLRGVDEGRIPDHIRQAYQQMRQRKGFVPITGR